MKTETRIIHVPADDRYLLDEISGADSGNRAVTEPIYKGELGGINCGFTLHVVAPAPEPGRVIAPMFVKPRVNVRPYLKKKKGRS